MAFLFLDVEIDAKVSHSLLHIILETMCLFLYLIWITIICMVLKTEKKSRVGYDPCNKHFYFALEDLGIRRKLIPILSLVF